MHYDWLVGWFVCVECSNFSCGFLNEMLCTSVVWLMVVGFYACVLYVFVCDFISLSVFISSLQQLIYKSTQIFFFGCFGFFSGDFLFICLTKS